jgi:hypothetical protein
LNDQAEKNKAAAQSQVTASSASTDAWAKKQSIYRNRLAAGDQGAVADELRASFDQAGIKGVTVGNVIQTDHGTVQVYASITDDDYNKLNEHQKNRLAALGITPSPPGSKPQLFVEIPTKDEQKRIDNVEKVLMSSSDTTKLKFESTQQGVADASAKQWVSATVGGTSVAKMAEDPHSRAEVQDKLNVAKSSAAASYTDAAARAAETCQDNHDDMVKRGLDPTAADKKCADDKKKALAEYNNRLAAIGDEQKHVDQLNAPGNVERLKAYKELLAQKKQQYVNEFANVGGSLYWQQKGVSADDVAGQRARAQAAYKALFAEVGREQTLVDNAVAKMGDVSAGGAGMDAVTAPDPGLLGKVTAPDSKAEDVFSDVMKSKGDLERKFERAMDGKS